MSVSFNNNNSDQSTSQVIEIKSHSTNNMASNSKLPQWVREFLAELAGTYALILFGNGAIANYLLNRNSKFGSDQFAVAFSYGIGGMVGIAAAAPISGAHLNPAVTLAFVTMGKIPIKKMAHYFLGQYLGSFLASLTIFAVYYDGIQAYDSGTRIPWNMPDYDPSYADRVTGGIFSTYPAPFISIVGSLVDQIVCTFALVFAIMALTSTKTKIPDYLQPFMIGMVISGLIVAFGLNCGAVLNPARDLAPRFMQLIVGYGIDSFKPVHSLYWLTAGLIGPHIGAIIGAWTFGLLFHYDKKSSNEESKPKNTYLA